MEHQFSSKVVSPKKKEKKKEVQKQKVKITPHQLHFHITMKGKLDLWTL